MYRVNNLFIVNSWAETYYLLITNKQPAGNSIN